MHVGQSITPAADTPVGARPVKEDFAQVRDLRHKVRRLASLGDL